MERFEYSSLVKVPNEKQVGKEAGSLRLLPRILDRWTPCHRTVALMNALNHNTQMPKDSHESPEARLRRKISHSLSNNQEQDDPAIAHRRAVSAYFYYLPKDDLVTVLWEFTDPHNKDAKLHTRMNAEINELGQKVSSGHIARLEGNQDTYVALFDELVIVPSNKWNLGPDDPLVKTINTLHQNGIIPITSNGTVQPPVWSLKKGGINV